MSTPPEMEDRPDRPATLSFYPSRIKGFGLLLMVLLLLGACWSCTRLPGLMERIVGWCGMLFFGLGLVILPERLLKPRSPHITIGPDGIDDHHQGYGFIPWEEIEALSVWRTHGSNVLCVHTRDPDAFVRRLSPAKQKAVAAHVAVGAGEVSLHFAGLAPGLYEAIRHCEHLGFPVDNH